MKDLDEILQNVNDQKSMAKFVSNLANDYSENINSWTNNDLESFLSALSAWIEDMEFYYKNTGQFYDEKSISWKVFADMLMASKLYE